MQLDPHRPRYHFLPPENWMNDPNGMIQWKGRYHMFYQYNPNGAFWGTIHWGHAMSTDLVHWTHLPLALAPTPDGPDASGCFSGCAVNNNGVATIVYTGVQGADYEPQVPCVAISTDDDLRVWTKYSSNPVIAASPLGADQVGFRDHSAWREGDIWYQVIGSGIKGVGGAALLYRSVDLLHWEYMHPLCVGDVHVTEPVWTGPMWECPLFLNLGDKRALIVSVWDHQTLYTVVMVGSYIDHRFTPETAYKLDFGNNYFYAPQALVDDTGRILMWGWIQEGRSIAAQITAGWSGVMSLPRVVSLRPDGLLKLEPAPEVAMLRGEHCHFADITLAPSATSVLDGVRGDCLELIVEIERGDATAIGFKLRCSPDNTEQTLLVYDYASGTLTIDNSHSSTAIDTIRDIRSGVFALDPGESLQLHIFLDCSVIEVFANDRACLTGRAYPSHSHEDSLGIDVFAQGGSATLKTLDIWEMGTIWE